jgi:hypothetical protein
MNPNRRHLLIGTAAGALLPAALAQTSAGDRMNPILLEERSLAASPRSASSPTTPSASSASTAQARSSQA